MPAAKTATPAPAPARAPATPAQASLYQQLRGHLAELKLHDAAEALPAVLDQASTESLTMTAALERLLAIEVTANQARRLAGRLRFASLPSPATLEDFDYDAAPAVDPSLIAELATCRYLANATNVLLNGPPGLGKTHLAIGLARKAAEAGYRTYFTTAADLAARCHRAANTSNNVAGHCMSASHPHRGRRSGWGQLRDRCQPDPRHAPAAAHRRDGQRILWPGEDQRRRDDPAPAKEALPLPGRAGQSA